MATEASKTRATWTADELALFTGSGIDIGCGIDPVFPTVERFDQQHGDANHITRYVTRTYDFVFSSHTLEHLRDPAAALREWFSLVKPGGHLIVLVPDEDLYEQGAFPSAFNGDHKATFTISKNGSWSPRSYNLLELAKSLEGEIVSLKLQDQGLDRRLLRHRPGAWARRLSRIFLKCRGWFHGTPLELGLARVFYFFGAAIDQTALSDLRLAQIQLIVKRR